MCVFKKKLEVTLNEKKLSIENKQGLNEGKSTHKKVGQREKNNMQ